MSISRRSWLAMTAAGVWSAVAGRRPESAAIAADSELERRIRRIVDEYGDQGFHRTGTDVDRRSGDWLFDNVERIGVRPAREPFSLTRVDPAASVLTVGDRSVEGLPLFDGAFTSADGMSGRFGPIDADADIGLVEARPNTAGAGALGEARRRNRHKGIVCVTRGGRPGLCPNNADQFLEPFGPPVLQVSSEHWPLLREHAERHTPVRLIAAASRTATASFNVTATLRGADPALPPLVVMTPRSGWYGCASERGGGIVCWLELIRLFHARRPPRDIVFVASSGHELGHLGINAFVDARPGIVARAIGWMHFGANIGASTPQPDGSGGLTETDPAQRSAAAAIAVGSTVQASDDASDARLSRAMSVAGLRIGRHVPRGVVPGGEAEVVHRGGGRYVSVIGGNGLFHHPEDRGSKTVDVDAIVRFTTAFADVARAVSANT